MQNQAPALATFQIANTYIYIYIYMCVCVCICKHTDIYIYIYIYVCVLCRCVTSVYMYILYIYICVCVCECVCVDVYTPHRCTTVHARGDPVGLAMETAESSGMGIRVTQMATLLSLPEILPPTGTVCPFTILGPQNPPRGNFSLLSGGGGSPTPGHGD